MTGSNEAEPTGMPVRPDRAVLRGSGPTTGLPDSGAALSSSTRPERVRQAWWLLALWLPACLAGVLLGALLGLVGFLLSAEVEPLMFLPWMMGGACLGSAASAGLLALIWASRSDRIRWLPTLAMIPLGLAVALALLALTIAVVPGDSLRAIGAWLVFIASTAIMWPVGRLTPGRGKRVGAARP